MKVCKNVYVLIYFNINYKKREKIVRAPTNAHTYEEQPYIFPSKFSFFYTLFISLFIIKFYVTLFYIKFLFLIFIIIMYT